MVQPEIYIFMGPPGAGKGTLASKCKDELGWKQLSTGVLLREQTALQTDIGKQIDLILKSGKLVPDNLIVEMVGAWLKRQMGEKAIILDGFPRTVPQAQALLNMLKKALDSNFKLYVVRLDLNDDMVVQRLSHRAICSNSSCQAVYVVHEGQDITHMHCLKCSSPLIRRSDDEEQTIRKRLLVYHVHEHALLDFFKKAGERIIEIPANRSMEQVFDYFKQKVMTLT